MREYIIPNWHAVLVHAPLGLMSIGIVMEFFGFVWRRSTARVAARWMIVVGVVAAVPTATSGIYAYFDALKQVSNVGDEQIDFGSKWDELKSEGAAGEKIFSDEFKAKGLENPAELLKHHIWQTCGATGVIFLVVITWIACSDRWRKRLYPLLLLLLLAGEGLLIFGSHHGGLAVYAYGVSQEPMQPMKTPDMKPTAEEVLKSYAPPAQVHVTMAGWTLSLALVALALCIRAMCHPEGPGDEEWAREHQGTVMGGEVADAVGLNPDVPATARGAHNEYEVNPAAEPPVGSTAYTDSTMPHPGAHFIKIPTARFWFLSLICAVVAFASGLWMMNFFSASDKGGLLRDLFQGQVRPKFHAYLGSAIVVLTLLLSLFSLAVRKMRWVVSALALLLLLAIAAEIWMGVLLMFDSHKGGWKGFNPPGKSKKDESRLIVPALPRM